MAKFVSKWKAPDDDFSDIANLKYPHKVLNADQEDIGTIATVEDAEALLDWYKHNYDHNMITQKLVKASSGPRKLRGAMERKQYLEARELRRVASLAEFEKAKATENADKENWRKQRQEARDTEALKDFLPIHTHSVRSAVQGVLDLADRLRQAATTIDKEGLTRATVDLIGEVARALPAATEGVRRTHFNVATTRLFAVHCQRVGDAPPVGTRAGKKQNRF